MTAIPLNLVTKFGSPHRGTVTALPHRGTITALQSRSGLLRRSDQDRTTGVLLSRMSGLR